MRIQPPSSQRFGQNTVLRFVLQAGVEAIKKSAPPFSHGRIYCIHFPRLLACMDACMAQNGNFLKSAFLGMAILNSTYFITPVYILWNTSRISNFLPFFLSREKHFPGFWRRGRLFFSSPALLIFISFKLLIRPAVHCIVQDPSLPPLLFPALKFRF